jgi:hypothetical protein
MSARPQPQRSVAVGGDIRDSILVLGDNNVLEVALGDDAILRRLLDEGRVRMQRRSRPRTPPPPPFADRVGREAELAAVVGAVGHVNLHGTAGIGKTYVLLAALDADAAYVATAGRSVDDVLQAMCDELFECEPPLVLTPSRRRQELWDVDAVVALDDVRTAPQETQHLLTEAPRCRFVVASRQRTLAQSTSVRLAGLPEAAGQQLLAVELGRPLEPGERAAAARLASQLGGHPLMLRQAAGLAVDTGVGLVELADALETADPVRALSARVQASLELEDRELVEHLAVASGAPLGTELVAELVRRPDAAERLAALEARHLVVSHSPRYSLVGALAEAPPSERLHHLRERAATVLARWAERAEPTAVVDEARSLLALLAWAHEAGRHALALRLARALDRPLALERRWSAWLATLQVARDAAAASGDAAAEAWALHQLGTRAYALGRPAAAVELLEDALHRRESLGDRRGAANTRHNLEFIRGDGPPRDDDDTDDEEPPGDDRTRRMAGRGVLAILGAIAALLLGTVVALGGTGHGSDPAPPITTTTSDSPASATPPAGHEKQPATTHDDPSGDSGRGDDPGGRPSDDPSAQDDPGDDPGTEDDPGDDPGTEDDPGDDPGTEDEPGDVPPDDAGTTDDETAIDPPPSDPPPSDAPPASTLPDDTQDYGTCPGCGRPPPGPR